MTNFKIYLLLFLHFFFNTHSQTKNNYEFVGALKLNGSDEQVISYKVVINEEKGIVKGYSITDLGGEHETKNSIIGSYDKTKKVLSFKENDIVYTKSSIQKNSFCYVNFSGIVNLKNANPKIDSKFTSFFKNGGNCVNGTIQLIGLQKIMKLVTKVNKKLQSSKKIDKITKEKSNPIKMIDSLNSNILKEKQLLQMFTKDKTVKFVVSDQGVEDGDIINIYVNSKLILENYVVVKEPKVIEIPTSNKIIIEVEAVNEGTMAPNTANVVISDTKNELKTITKLTKGKKTSITIEKD